MKTPTILFAAALLISCAPKGESAAPEPAAAETAAPAEASPPEPSGGDDPVILPVAGTGETCGGIAAIKCAGAADWCAMEVGACVEVADAAGTCTAKPEICTMDYTPVCGCDGKTYSNACTAAAAGVNVAATGECQ